MIVGGAAWCGETLCAMPGGGQQPEMDTMIAYCGLDCEGCPIHLATLEQDHSKQRAMRLEIARICSQQYCMDLLPQDVTDCDGCRSQTGRLFSGCTRCEIRKCAIDRKLTSCAFCVNYACDKLRKHFDTDPAARTRLEVIRSAT
ncbi:MAG: hypothetical protein COS95_08700 [Ignavibacteriales bacterium CG07_land_8_20_14_0_80_59_12]|nr:MAG: hypothetical protein COS95_08700 [Ignavibacteriales bacterium CG07_land_8_20_14_0_80_59_12]